MSKEGTLEMPEMLVINSPGFTVWTEHFTRLQRLVDKAEGHLMTILGIGRMSSPSNRPYLKST